MSILHSVMVKIVTGHIFVSQIYFSSDFQDGKEDAHLRRSRHDLKPSVTLLNHPEQATLPSQQQAIKTFRAAEAARCATERQIVLNEDATNPILSPTTSPSHSNSPVVPSETDTTVPLALSGPK